MALIVVSALPGRTAERVLPLRQRPSASIYENSPLSAEESVALPMDEELAGLEPGKKAPRLKVAAKTTSITTADVSSGSPAAARTRPAQRTRVVQTNFQPEIGPVPDNGPGHVIRPFRKIADIVPYDNYEPDPELAAKDRCNNLCPRPQGGDCPDCLKDGDGNALPCPECPWEQDLRRIGRAPGEPDRPYIARDFAHIHYCWEPTNLYHNPIYFEDVDLERYGHTRNYLIQPLFSIAKFAVQLGGLPYQMSIYPIWDKQYSLGYYRPGEEVPCKYPAIPLNARAAAVEAGVITGSYFLFAPGVGP